METFEVQFREKLKKLTNSQQSIESLSLWIIYHSKFYKNAVKIWVENILASNPSQQLTLLYVCNDVLQNSRKKTQNFINEFSEVLPSTLDNILPNFKEIKKVHRIFDVWKERSVFSPTFISKLKSIGEEKEHHLIKYLNLKQNYNQIEAIDKLKWENKSIEEIKNKIKLEENYKKELENENKIRLEYMEHLQKEIEIQQSTSKRVSEIILKCNENLIFLNNLQSNQKRSFSDVEEMNFENLTSQKKFKQDHQLDQVDWSTSMINIQPIDVTTIVNALDDQKEESSLDLLNE